MSTPRLTNDTREAIISGIMTHAFGKDLQIQKDTEIQFSHDLFESVYKNDLETLRTAGSHMFPESNSFRISFEGSTQQCSFYSGIQNVHFYESCGIYPSKPEKSTRRVPDQVKTWRPITVLDPKTKLGKRFEALEKSHDALLERVVSAHANAKAILTKTSSFKKLLEIWPEIETFVKPFMKSETTAQVPMIQVEALNTSLGLPA